ncbi:hypothetical protein [Corynebacterium heidelbergense]|uniref:DUF4355 domain-containing protein n=1 Tax=Corynebacterium heidelbergense TaxID=2055947 RepID=A0A364VCA2_9CORY|nr:hypothetical protein [Corynebacterium heidelbergense]RAV34250.1 hypothetical protein CWC39_04155 [Corynebacterium heidelbergense]WCZ36978.1 hypothetical protein CHEID_07225 [Corynebacterium heidelbergense]
MPDQTTTTHTNDGDTIAEKATSQEVEATAGDADQSTDSRAERTETRGMPTPKDVAEATTDSGDESDEDEQDTDDSGDADSDGDSDQSPEDVKKLLAKIRKSNREAQKLRERATNAERELGQLRAAMQTGLPLEMATRLRGSTPEELKQDAESLLQVVSSRRRAPGWGPDDGVWRGDGRATRPEDELDLDKVGSRIYGG